MESRRVGRCAGEARNVVKRRGTKDNATNDLGNDLWLVDVLEDPSEGLGEDDDDDELDDEEGDGLGGV
jgi:hypothetical protein